MSNFKINLLTKKNEDDSFYNHVNQRKEVESLKEGRNSSATKPLTEGGKRYAKITFIIYYCFADGRSGD